MVSLPFEVIVEDAGMKQADAGAPTVPSYRLFHDPGEWEKHWRSAAGSIPPAIDFAREFVLCVYLGTKPTGGYAIAVRGVQFDAARRRLDCTLELTEPAPGTMLIQALTNPCALYRVSLPAGMAQPSTTQFEILFHRDQHGVRIPVELQPATLR